MLDHVQAQLTGGLEQLVDDLAVGSALEPFPDERGQAIAAMRVVEPLQLDQGVPPVAFGDPWESSLDPRPERVDDGAEVHPGQPAPDVGVFREHEPHRQPVPRGRGDEAGQPDKGIGVDEALLGEVDPGDAAVQVERQHAVETRRVQAGAAMDRHEREYRSSRDARPEARPFCG